MTPNNWTDDWAVGIRVWVERAGAAILGEGRAELLSEIDRHHSITKAAKAAGMSYRRAWSMVQAVNAAAGEPLIETAAGGPSGGGARLTARGRLAIQVYERIRQSLVESAARELQRAIRPNAPAAAAVHLAAAISLQEAIGQVLAEFALIRPAIHVRTIFGASNELADHLLAGAPCDIFISAEPAELDRLAAKGLNVDASRRVVAKNTLAVIGAVGLKEVRKVAALLSNQVKQIAIAEAPTPLGRHSEAYLQSARVYDRIVSKVLWVDNSRAVLSAVASKAADVGLAFASDASREGDWRTLFRVPASKASASYVAAVIRGGQQSAGAFELLDFLVSLKAQRCLRRCGLRPASS
jgi:molybdenum ABC transporter molybdate-binding protein